MVYIIVSNFRAVRGVYTVTGPAARNMDHFK